MTMAHCLSASSCVQTQMLWSRQEKGFYVAAADTQHIWIDLVYFSKGSKKYMSVFSDVSLYWRVTQLHLDCACGKKGVRSCAGWFSRDHSNKKKKVFFFPSFRQHFHFKFLSRCFPHTLECMTSLSGIHRWAGLISGLCLLCLLTRLAFQLA